MMTTHSATVSGMARNIDAQPYSSLNVQTFGGKLFHADLMDRHCSPDFVLPIGPSAKFLAHMMIRKPVVSALDLGTGCGVLGILAADNASVITATDINPRALEMTQLNAQINGIANIETLHGSYFEPVYGRRFDLILANMPYVITPQSRYLYRDMVSVNGMDSLALIHQIPRYLQTNGFAQINLSWTHPVYQNPWEKVMDAIQGTGMDGMLFLAADFTAEEYAAFWLEGQDEKIDEWAGWYRSHGMERIALGHLVLHSRPSSKNWFTIFRLDAEIQNDVGEYVEQLFHAQDQIEALQNPRDEILDAVFQCKGLQILPSDNSKVILVEPSEFQLKLQISASTMEVLKWLDGRKTLHTVFSEMNQKCTQLHLREIQLLMQFGMLQIIENPTQRRISK